MISRRAFLVESAAALTAVAASPHSLRFLPPARRAKRVLMAGAGAAGAWARRGRIHTVRAPFADGLYAEAGAMYLGSNALAASYARRLER